ncbi:MAG: phasin family protein [Rhodospirillales bacterium]|nr:phasin family protein [Alphaproteobacteria bacterium]MBL6948181.1 phasin family protein [Rhodospirillales bacterium]
MTNAKNKTAADAIKGYEQAVAYSKESIDAVMKSNAIFVKGLQDINTVLFGLAQASLEDSVAATQRIFDCKTVSDVMDTQAELAKAGYEKALDDSRKVSELSVKVAEAASQPITKQVNAAVEKFSKPMAA